MTIVDVKKFELCSKWIEIGKTAADTKRLCWFGRIGFLLTGFVLLMAAVLIEMNCEISATNISQDIYFSAALFVFGILSLLIAWIVPPLLFKHIVCFELLDESAIVHFSNNESISIEVENVSHVVLAYNHPSFLNYSYDNLKVMCFLKNSTSLEIPVGYCKGEDVEVGLERLRKTLCLTRKRGFGNFLDDREYRRRQTLKQNPTSMLWIVLLIVAAFWLRGIYYEYWEIQLYRVGKKQNGMVTDIILKRGEGLVKYTFWNEDGKEYHGQSHLNDWVGPVPRINQQIDVLCIEGHFEYNAARSAVSGERSISYHLLMFSIVILIASMILKSYGIFRIVYFRKKLYLLKRGSLIEESSIFQSVEI